MHPVRPTGERRNGALVYANRTGSIAERLTVARGYALPAGVVTIAASIVVPAGCVLEGSGGLATTIEAQGDFPAVVLLDGARVENLRVTRTNTAGATSAQVASDGVAILGHDVTVEGCAFVDQWNAVRVGTMDDLGETWRGVRILSCVATHAAPSVNSSLFAYLLQDCDGAVVRDCSANGGRLDLIKTRRRVSHALIDGGIYERGQAGGVDLYAGASYVTVRNVLCRRNAASGVVIKSNAVDAAWGTMDHITLDNVTSRDNGGAGLYLMRDPGAPFAPAHIAVRGGTFNGNLCGSVNGSAPTSAGLYIAGADVTIEGARAIGNLGPGLWVDPAADGVTTDRLTLADNGAASPVPSNALISGARVTMRDTTFAGSTHAAHVIAPAVGTVIDGWRASGHGGELFAIGGTPGVTVHGRGPGGPLLRGGPGSTWIDTTTGARWRKASIAADENWVAL